MRLVVLLAALAVAACQTPCPSPPTDVTVTTFHCEDGSDVRVTFAFENATVEQEGYTTLVLPSRVSGSAFRYADGGATLRGRADEISWTRPGAAETTCQRLG